jgi:hypothetical protein
VRVPESVFVSAKKVTNLNNGNVLLWIVSVQLDIESIAASLFVEFAIRLRKAFRELRQYFCSRYPTCGVELAVFTPTIYAIC